VRGSGDYDRKKRYSCLCGGLCCCISFWFWREIRTFFVAAGNFDYDWKKKDTVVCWQEIGSFFVVAGNFHYYRKKKMHYDQKIKRYSRLSDGCAVLAITTRKKKIQSSVWRVVLCNEFVLVLVKFDLIHFEH
jgi:hypothetical protein